MTEGKVFSTVSKILTLQLLVVIILTAGFYLSGGWKQALSPLLGAVAAFIPNLYFALRISANSGQPAQKIMRSFYAGEAGKWILTAMLFYLIFQIPHIDLITLLIGYVAALSVFWFALLMRD
jgi:ATP synthase protein I